MEFIFLLTVLVHGKDYIEFTFDQNQLVRRGSDSGTGYYLNEPVSAGDSIYIETPEMKLDKGRYVVEIHYENAGGGKLRVEYAEGRYGWNIAGNLLLEEGQGKQSFDITVRDSERSVVVRAYQRMEREDDAYLLIRNITVHTIRSAWITKIISVLILIVFADLSILCFVNIYFRNIIRKNGALILLFGSVVFLTSLPVFTNYIGGEMLDIRFHLTRIAGLAEGLKSGAFPVRIQPGWLNAHGYAVSVFYGDIFLYFPAVLYLLGMPLQRAYQCFVLVVNISTIWIACYSFHRMTKNREIAVFGAILYTGNMYRMTALYMRAAVGAYCAMVFFPLVAAGLYQIYSGDEKTQKKGILPLCIGLSGILESHIISFEMTAAFAFLLGVLLWRKTFHKKRFTVLCKAAGMTAAVNLWFLVPFLDYMRDDFQINTKGTYIGDHYKMQERGLFLPQIFSTRFHVKSISTDVTSGIAGEMPMTIGLALTAVFFLGILFWAVEVEKKRRNKELELAIGLTSLSFALTLHVFPYIWIGRRLPITQMAFRSIQYPWRFLTISTILLLWVFCIIGQNCGKEREKLFRYISVILCGVCLLQAVDYTSEILNEMSNSTIYSRGNLSMDDIGGGEYLPLNTDRSALTNRLDCGGELILKDWKREYNKISLTVENPSDVEETAVLPLLYYRYYRATDGENGLKVTFADNGKIKLYIPGSYHGRIDVSFQEPVIWRIAEIISALTAIYMIFDGIKRKARESKQMKSNCSS